MRLVLLAVPSNHVLLALRSCGTVSCPAFGRSTTVIVASRAVLATSLAAIKFYIIFSF